MSWQTLDTEALLRNREQQHEATTSANVGAYPVPLGGVLRPATVVPVELGSIPHHSGGVGVSPGYQSLEDALSAYEKATKGSR